MILFVRDVYKRFANIIIILTFGALEQYLIFTLKPILVNAKVRGAEEKLNLYI